MTNYEVALFLHVVGMTGMFAGIGITLGVLHFAKHAERVEAVRALMPLGALGGKAIPVFSLLVLATGAYMVEDVWKWDRSWVEVSLVAFGILFAMGPLINAQRVKAIAIEAAQAADGTITPALHQKLHDPVLHTSEVSMTLATLGIVYLMVTKPGMAEALVAMAVAVGAGLLISVQAWVLRRPQPDAA
jgi:hypothetical protein